jgi:hypothetical protein
MTITAHGKLVRQGLGLPANASEGQVRAACQGRSAAEVCDAVSCHCVSQLADGTPGITPDVPLAMISAHEMLLMKPPAGCNSDDCCKTDPAAKRGLVSGLAAFADLTGHQRRAIKDKK